MNSTSNIIKDFNNSNKTISHSPLNSLSKSENILSFENINKEKLIKTIKNLLEKSKNLIDLIGNHNLLIKGKICKQYIHIMDTFEAIQKEIIRINENLSFLPKSNLAKTDILHKITQSINDANMIKALLVKISNLCLALKNAKCKKFQNLLKRKMLIEKNLNSLVENIQKYIRKHDLKMNLVILT